MNTFLLVLVFAVVVIGEDDIDWSTVKRRDIRLPPPFDLDQSLVSPRIVGGHEVIPHSIPYQVGLLIFTFDETYFCGGSLISTTYVLTAAHCLEDANEIEVRLGAHRIMDDESTQQRILSTTYIVHDDWDNATLQNDIAVVELSTPAVLNAYVQLVQLPHWSDASNSFSHYQGRISGWGLDSDLATSLSEVLREVFAKIITNLECNISYLGQIQPTHICTAGYFGKGACNGDSGGPLVTDGKQTGIVSFRIFLGCGVGWPSAFTRVTSFLDWIEDNTDVTIYP